MSRGGRVLASLLLALFLGCGGSIPSPPTGPHVDEEATAVPYPPPPGKVEVVPEPPKEMKKPVWIDGEWQWRGRRWVWQVGAWQELNPGSYYAPATAVRLADGTLVYFTGKWKPRSKTPPPPPPSATAVPAAGPPASLTAPATPR